MKLDFIKYNSKLGEGQVCVNMYHRDGIKVYDSEGNGAKIPFDKVDEFLGYVHKRINGKPNVRLNLGNKNYLELPKSKIEKISEEVNKAKDLGINKTTLYQKIL